MLSSKEKDHFKKLAKKPNKTPKETAECYVLMMRHKQENIKENRKIDLIS